MAEALTCDCGCEDVAVQPVTGWLVLDRTGIDVSLLGDDQWPLHFVSLAHLANWLGRRLPTVAAPPSARQAGHGY